jgi:hypothetical protein
MRPVDKGEPTKVIFKKYQDAEPYSEYLKEIRGDK